MAAPEVYKSLSASDLTTTSSTYTTLGTLTIDRSGQSGSKNFLIGGFSGITSSDSAALLRARFTLNGTEYAHVGDTTNDQLDVIGNSRWWGVGFIKQVSISNVSVDLDFDGSTDLGTYTAQGLSLFAVEFGSDWEYAESDTESSTDSTTFQDKTALTFTPGSTQDYYLVATFELLMEDETDGGMAEARFIIDGTEHELWNPTGLEASGNDNRYLQLGFMDKVNLDTNSHTIKIQYRTQNTGGADTAFIRNARIVAIPVGGEFIVSANDTIDDTPENLTGVTDENTGFDNVETLSFTASSADHLVFGYMKFGERTGNTYETAVRMSYNGTAVRSSQRQDNDTDATPNRYDSFVSGAVQNPGAGTANYIIQIGSESTASASHDVDNKHIFALELGDTAGAAGPASLKTRDTIAVASIKTIDGIAIASVKTLDTIA